MRSHLTLLLILISLIHCCAQNVKPKSWKTTYELKRELLAAKDDTTKIALQTAIGKRLDIFRVSYWDSLLLDAKRLGMEKEEVMILGMLAYIISYDNYEKGLAYAEKGLELAKTSKNKVCLLESYNSFVTIYWRNNKREKLIDYLYKGLELSYQLGEKTYTAPFKEKLSTVYYMSGENEKAFKELRECMAISEEIKDYATLSYAMADLGAIYRLQDDSIKTAYYYLQCKKYLQYFDETIDKVAVYDAIADGHMLRYEFDSAMAYLLKAQKIYKSTNNKKGIASLRALIAQCTYNMGNVKEAKKLVLEDIKYARSINFLNQIPSLATQLTTIYARENNYKEALEAYKMYVRVRDSVSGEANRKLLLQKQFDHELEKRENENKLLAQKNEIQELQLSQNRYLMLGLGILLLLVLLIAYLFVRQNKFQSQQQTIQLEQKLLRTQMNPHFIFNTLQAIQNFILKGNEKRAVEYLSSFATITRDVLENSRMEAIPLKKEIRLLENYMQLQKLRFGNRFESEIYFDASIDTEHIYIPPMLSQPFIENAIEHGLHDVESDGKIQVRYSLRGSHLLLDIIDNGHGIKKTKITEATHLSLATEITRERIILMNRKAKKKTSFIVMEAFPGNESRKGVRVSFLLPIENT